MSMPWRRFDGWRTIEPGRYSSLQISATVECSDGDALDERHCAICTKLANLPTTNHHATVLYLTPPADAVSFIAVHGQVLALTLTQEQIPTHEHHPLYTYLHRTITSIFAANHRVRARSSQSAFSS